MKAKRVLILLFWLVPLLAAAQIRVDTSFEGSNVRILQITRNKVYFQPAFKSGQSTNVWYFFKVYGLKPNRPLQLFLSVKYPYFTGSYLAYSPDGKTWRQARISGTENGFKKFVIPAGTGDTLYIAATFPYTVDSLNAFLKKIAASPFADTVTLTVSEHGRRVPLVIITDTAKNNDDKDLIWVIARQHAFEVPASYCVEGFVDFLLSGDTLARMFRKNTVAYIVPMVDLDNVAEGKSGRMQRPVDFNRDWTDTPSHWNAVNAIKDLLSATSEIHNFRVFIDVHSVYPNSWSNSAIYFNIYPKTQEQYGNLQEYWDIFTRLSGLNVDDVTDFSQKPYADVYVKRNYPYTDFVFTFECPWNAQSGLELSNPGDLRRTGYELARALAVYLMQNITK